MPHVFLSDLRLRTELSGPETAPALVLVHGLGLDLRLWDRVMPHLQDFRVLRLDLRGHGQSDRPASASMGALIRDLDQVMAHHDMRDAVVVGHGLGGLMAQGLAVKSPERLRALVLTNSAAKIGHESTWPRRIAEMRDKGPAALREAMLTRWLGRRWREAPCLADVSAIWDSVDLEGWALGAKAMSGADFYQTTAALGKPLLAIAGAQDGETPPDLMRETAELVEGHHFVLMREAGHLPMLEAPEAWAGHLRAFALDLGAPKAAPCLHFEAPEPPRFDLDALLPPALRR